MSEKSVTCGATIMQCRNKTTHESGLCHWHRYTGGNNGPGART